MNKIIKDELVTECERLTEIINNEDVGSDKWKMAYAKKQDILEKMLAYEKMESDYVTKQEERELQKQRDESMREIEEQKMKQHAEIEQKRRDTEKELEKRKEIIKYICIGADAVMLFVPLAISIKERHTSEDKMYNYEEHGRLVSTVARQWRLPEILWKRKKQFYKRARVKSMGS